MTKATGLEFRIALLNNKKWLKIGGLLLVLASAILFISSYLRMDKWEIWMTSGFAMASLVMLIQAFKFWQNKAFGKILHILAGLLDGFLAIVYWLESYNLFVLGLWLLWGSFVITGIFRIYVASTQGIFYLGWEWTFLCGLINLLLSGLIIFQFYPPSLMIAVVCLVDFFFTGLAFFMLGVGANKVT